MKIFINRPLLNTNDKPFTVLGEDQKDIPLTLGMAICGALRGQCQMDSTTGNGLIEKRFKIAKLVERKQSIDKHVGAHVEISTDDVAMIKKRLEMHSASGNGMEGFVVAAAFEAIEDNTDSEVAHLAKKA